MAKKSRKKARDTTGCIPAFIGMFDFRQGRYTRRLLSDKKNGVSVRNNFDVLSDMEEMNEYVNDTETRNPESPKASIKALVAEEMSKIQESKNVFSSTDKQILSEMGFDHDMVEFFSQDVIGSKASPSANASQGKGVENKKATEKRIQEALSDITDLFSARRSIDSKEITSIMEVQQRELMDALEILDLNKDMFLKRLQDPNSVFRKHFVDLQNAHAQQKLNENQAKKSRHRFSTKKDKSDESSSQHLKRIVVLKPSPNTDISSVSSSRLSDSLKTQEETSVFSIKDLKRRLKNMIGESTKRRDSIAMDGVLHKVPYGYENSKMNNKTSKFSTFFKKGNKNADVNHHNPTISSSLHQESLYYEAKKRLAEMLKLDAPNEVPSPRKVSKPLGKLLSLKEYDMLSPRFSPLREKEVMQKIKQEDSTCSGSSIEIVDNSLNDYFSEKARIHNETDLIHKGSPEIEDCDHPNISLDLSSDVHDPSNGGVCEEEILAGNSDLVPEVAKTTTHCVSVSNLEEFSARTMENIDCPRPVSDLEPNFLEDDKFPERVDLITEHQQTSSEEHQQHSSKEYDDIQPVISPQFAEANAELCTSITEIKLNYVKAVLEASGLNSYIDLEKSQSLDQLLDPFVFDEVEVIYDELIDDSKLMFDCINEVLLEMKKRYLVSSPWISIIKSNIRPIPVGKNFVIEVCKGVEKHLDMVSPYTLDMVIKKDLEVGPWFNVWLESEGAVFDIGEAILDHILEETILELWD